MRIRSNLRGTRGFVRAYANLIRFKYMVSDTAKKRVRILSFWDKHGTEAATEAFGVSLRSLQRWQAAIKRRAGRLEPLNPKKAG